MLKKWIALILSAILLLAINACGDTSNEPSSDENSQNIETAENDDAEDSESDENENREIIYALDDGVNEYINYYNEANPDEPITSEMVNPFTTTAGKEVPSSARYYVDGFEVIIDKGKSVYVGYTSSQSHTDDDYKEMFIKHMKGFNLGLSDEELSDDWDKKIEESSLAKYDKYEFELSPGNITYFKVTVK